MGIRETHITDVVATREKEEEAAKAVVVVAGAGEGEGEEGGVGYVGARRAGDGCGLLLAVERLVSRS